MDNSDMFSSGSGQIKRVCLIVINDFVNDSRVLKEAISLRSAGYEVQVLALYASGLLEVEVIAGIPVRRVKLLTRAWSKNRSVQLIKYIEFTLKAMLHCRQFNILHCNDLNTLPIGVLSKLFKLGRQSIVYDAHEFEIHRHGSARGVKVRLTSFFESMLLRYVDAVITVSRSIAKAYRRIYGIKMPALVLNCPSYRKTGHRYDKLREELAIGSNQKIFLYQGSLSHGRGIEMFIDAFSKRVDNCAVVVFMGYGPLEESIKFAAERYKNIFFRAAVTPEELLNYTASADFGLMSVEQTCLSYTWCLPNKLFEYIMAGLITLSSDLVEPRRIIRQFGIGIVTNEWTIKGINESIDTVMTIDWTEAYNQMEFARRIYCWENQERILLQTYSELKECIRRGTA